jgi:hypothetical protein
VGGLTPATNTTAPIRHRLPDFFEELSGTPVVRDPTARRFRGDCPGFLGLSDHVGRDAPMSLATALKGAMADARALQNPDFRRL